jgi:hypothetical protein
MYARYNCDTLRVAHLMTAAARPSGDQWRLNLRQRDPGGFQAALCDGSVRLVSYTHRFPGFPDHKYGP